MIELIDEPLPDLLVIKPKVYKDERGFFLETWQKIKNHKIGLDQDFVQENWSRSTFGILRGLHFQVKHPQGKLVSVHNGKVFDVAVDLRKESKTYGKWYGLELSDENHLQMYVPPGFAHGFCVLSDVADFVYKCTDYYYPNDESGIIWNDTSLNIKWPIKNPIISDKDSILSTFNKLSSNG
jgi:dTDP-4-dehydrorhamnose 3,5-epimerase